MIVSTKYGKLEGITQNGCHIFKGVPYAKPPVGALRFHKPQEPECWEGVLCATEFRARSMQGPQRPGFYCKEFYSHLDFQTPASEDGLYLNIWVPEGNFGGKLPVAVYVHGGAFMSGAGSNLPFVCTNLAKAGVIVVTINYRLGAFGFLCHPLLSVEGENAAGGNFGLWDQLAAIRWVKENIESFGGDPENITAFGQSAGAMSLQTLVLSEQAEGLIQKSILQSGGGYRNPLSMYRTIEEASEFGEYLLEALGMEPKAWMNSPEERERTLHLLYDSTADEIMDAVGQVVGKSFQLKKGFPFVPVVDGELLTKDGNQLISEGHFLKIPYILGANGNDITTEGTEDPAPDKNLMNQGNVAYAETANAAVGSPAYVYYFDRKLPGDDAGAFHSAELWYVFGSLDYCWRPFEQKDYELSAEMITYWSNFMKTGNPNEPDHKNAVNQEVWKLCTKEDPYVQVLA